jgi:hypothetical protein
VPGTKPISAVHESATAPRVAQARIVEEPEIEMATKYLTIIRWRTKTPGGSPVHYGIVHYGTDPTRLTETAASPIRLNPDHPSTLFRVRLNNLGRHTDYYFKVDSIGEDGVSDGFYSSIKKFAIP